jgi:hypothetical protein
MVKTKTTSGEFNSEGNDRCVVFPQISSRTAACWPGRFTGAPGAGVVLVAGAYALYRAPRSLVIVQPRSSW